jgi:hypothetical protein
MNSFLLNKCNEVAAFAVVNFPLPIPACSMIRLGIGLLYLPPLEFEFHDSNKWLILVAVENIIA